MDINEEIKNLTEAFTALLEGHNLSWVPMRALLKGKIDLDKYKELNARAEAIPSSNDMHKNEDGKWDTSNVTTKSISSVRSGELSTDNRHIENGRNEKELEAKRKNDKKNGYPQAIAKAKQKHKEKMNDNNSYNSTMQQILDLTEAYANLLEAQDARGGAQKEVNKITRTKKDKNGEPVEVVSVADELFPYKGTAKEQYNQKILAKINDMIEGTATLEDLIQLIRQKKAVTMKESLQETLNQMMAVAEDVFTAIDKKYPEDSQRKRELNYNASINKSSEEGDSRWREEQLPYDTWHYKRYETKNSQGDYKNRLRKDEQLRKKLDEFDAKSEKIKNKLDRKREKIKNKVDKNLDSIGGKNIDYESAIKKSIERKKKKSVKEGLEETLNQMMAVAEEIILERNKENRAKKEKWELKTNHITKKEKKAVQDYAKEQGDEAKYHQIAANDYDHIYSQQPAKAPNGMRNPVADYFNGKYQEMLRNKGRNEQNIADEVEPLTKKLKNREHKFHDMVRGFHDPNLNH